ncbi:uncharacterized protein LOC122069705 [Macadamia integrifolia]|uniref:uncharacterized protein LOC122069705 n=1 Tax=Macadamia integrifolia TaxID=60698 RepID=UPI001C4EB94F|nr:uncharacterized protein LOC122069705 [Macadamia integrifolia]
MDLVYDSLSSNDTNKRSKNQMWDSDMDRTLFEFLDAQVAEGNKSQNGFKDATYVQASHVINSAHGLSVNKENIRNRVKSVKKVYRTLYAIVNTSGFGWNSELKQLTYHEDSVWNSYILEHPKAKYYKNKKFEFFDIWENIFGEDFATGQWARNRKARDNDQSHSQARGGDPMNFDDNAMESNTNVVGGDSQDPRTSPVREGPSGNRYTPRPKKQKQSVDFDQLAIIAEGIKDLAAALREPPKQPSPYQMDLTPILHAIREIPDISDVMASRSFEYLSANPVQANIFMSYDVSHRADFLWRHWHSQDPNG